MAISIIYNFFIFIIIMAESVFTCNNDYFDKLNKGLKNRGVYEQKGKILIDSVSQKLQQKILVSQVALPQQIGIKNLIIPKKNSETAQTNQEDLLKKVQNQKLTLLQKIRDLTKQQDDLKIKLRYSPKRSPVIYEPKIIEQDKQIFKTALQKSRRYQKQMQKKANKLKQLYKERSVQQIKQQQHINYIKRQQSRKQALQNLKKLQQKSAERKRIMEESLKKIKQIKQHNYRYLMNKQKDQQKILEQQKQYNKKLQSIKNSLKLDIQQIKSHEKKYQKHLQQSQHRLKNKSFIKAQSQKKINYNNYIYAFTKVIMDQQKLERYEKMNEGHLFKQRICKFQQKLSTQFKPKISNKSKFTPIKQSLSVHALSTAEQREKGIKYLQISKKLKDIEKQKQRRMTIASPKQKYSYKDYTKQLKYKAYQTAQTKFNTLIKHKSSLSDYESASKALVLASQIQSKLKLSNDQKLLHSVNNKIQLLKALQ